MSERLQTVLVRRTTAKRRITNIASRFSRVLTVDNACQTVHDLRIDMRNALETFRAVDDQLRPLLEAAEANALPTDKPIMSRTVSEDIINSADYITSAEDMLFEACRYIESHSPQASNISTTVASNVSEPRGQKVSFRPMTHDDCGLWFAQLEDVFSSLGITSQTNKFAALTTLLTEEEAYVVRDLTLLGRKRPADVFDTARKLFVQRFDLTIHQRLTRAFAIGGVDVNEKPSQWMARFRHASGDWTRDDVERWALLRRLPSSLRTTLETPSPPLHMAELLRKADQLYVTLPTTTVSSICEAPTELATAVYACDVPAVNALFRNRGSGKGSTEYKKPSSEDQLCWYHLKFRDQARYCTGLPCPRHRPDLKRAGNRKRETPRAVSNYWCCV